MQQKLSARESELKQLEEQNKAASSKWATEISGLQNRVKELEPLQQKLSAREAELRQLEEQSKVASNRQSAEISELQKRVRELEPLQQKLSAREDELKQLKEQNKTQSSKWSSEISGLQKRVTKLEPLEQRLSDRNAAFKTLESEHKARTAKLEALQKASDKAAESKKAAEAKHKSELEALRAKLKQAEALKAEVSSRDRKIGQFDKQVMSLKQSVDSQQSDVVSLKRQVKESQSETSKRNKELASLQKLHSKDVTTRDNEIERLKAMIEKLKQAPKPKPAPKPRPKPKPVTKAKPKASPKLTADGKKTVRKDGEDDLKLIFGIGPKIEKMLNQKGVTRFEHIAGWSKADVARYADMLDGFPDRIERDEWVLSAKQILDGSYNWEERRKAREALNKKKPAKKAKPKKAAKKATVTADGKKTTRKDGKDDLKLIFGIGPKIEKMLNDNGVNSFEDIAAWKKADIKKYADMLDGFPDRIEREEWVLSSKQIIDGTYNWTERQKANQAKKGK